MAKKRLSIILAIFFLVQIFTTPIELYAETCPLNPQTKVNPNEIDMCFKDVYDTIHLALFIYKLDAIKHSPKNDIIRNYADEFADLSRVRFDLEHIDIQRKGWTRYYPFSVRGRNFIIRIFLTSERQYQAKADTIFEGEIDNPAITFQVLDGVNALLKDCKIKPHTFTPTSLVEASP